MVWAGGKRVPELVDRDEEALDALTDEEDYLDHTAVSAAQARRSQRLQRNAAICGWLMPSIVLLTVVYVSYVFCGVVAADTLIRDMGRPWVGGPLLAVYLLLALLSLMSAIATRTAPACRLSDVPSEAWSLERARAYPIYECDTYGNPRWCTTCQQAKPDRSHHSGERGVCILKLDHYCAFLGCCVTYASHKFFVLFTIYTSLLSAYTLVATAVLLGTSPYRAYAHQHVFGCWISIVAIAAVGLAMTGGLSVSHVLFALRNATSFDQMGRRGRTYMLNVEFEPGSRAVITTLPGQQPWDLGAYRNWVAMMGPSPLLWFVPFPQPSHTRLRDGLHFEYNPDLIPQWREMARRNHGLHPSGPIAMSGPSA